ncbi:hypothetical protein ACFYZ2_14450 [Streptomyces sviceus]|uniref:hypothetical protein n=1 Tax=Streptomyces sviceus TaxID=285530 RepID=UPI0036B91144
MTTHPAPAAKNLSTSQTGRPPHTTAVSGVHDARGHSHHRYGPWPTVYTRFRRYALNGVFTRALQQIQAHADAVGDVDWFIQIDSTIVRAHQHAAATGRKGGPTGRTNRTITPSADPEES